MGNKAFDVTALGELLIDFTENGKQRTGKSDAGSQSGRCSMQRACNA